MKKSTTHHRRAQRAARRAANPSDLGLDWSIATKNPSIAKLLDAAIVSAKSDDLHTRIMGLAQLAKGVESELTRAGTPNHFHIGDIAGTCEAELLVDGAASAQKCEGAAGYFFDVANSLTDVLAMDLFSENGSLSDYPADASNMARAIQILTCIARGFSAAAASAKEPNHD